MRGRRAAICGLATLAATASAAKPEDASRDSRDQVKLALERLAPAFAKSPGRFDPNRPGTLANVIAKFAPARFHPVDEGELPTPRPGSTCPDGMANVDGRFCIDRYECSLVERLENGEERLHPHNRPPERGRVYEARSQRGVMPQGYLSGAQALRACEAVGKRLCAPVEWRAACGGSQGNAYPYGPERVRGRCHDFGSSPMLALYASTLNRGWGGSELNDPRLHLMPGALAKTGDHPGCVNDFGIYDMVGNLHEWTSDPNGSFQGGYWLDTSEHGDGCAYRTIAHGFDYHDYSIGFRCCATPSR